MQKRNFRHTPVITDSGKIAGIASAQDIIDSLALALEPRSSPKRIVESLEIPVHRVMALHPIVVEKGDGIAEVVKKLVTHNIGALPVADEMGMIQGIITLRDLVGLLGTASEPLGVKVSEIMTRNVTTIDSDATIADAVRLLSEKRIRRLPIISRNSGLLGMFTNKDVLRVLARIVSGESDSEAPFDKKVSDSMSREVMTANGDDDVRVAASRMMIFGIGGLAIDDPESKRITGIVTERDLVRRLSEVRSVNFLVESMKFELELQN